MTTTRWSMFCFALLLCAAPANAALWMFDPIVIDGLQETPPVATPAFGTGTAMLDDVSGIMTVSGTFSGLVGTSNNAHVHGYAATGSGPVGVVFGLTFDFGVTSGNYSGSGSVNVANALAGLTYVNIHSTFRPGGEIRGQIINPTKVPEPASLGIAVTGLALLFSIHRKRRAV